MLLTLLLYVMLGAGSALPLWLLWTKVIRVRVGGRHKVQRYLVPYTPKGQRDSDATVPLDGT
jgi:hypothetical protein